MMSNCRCRKGRLTMDETGSFIHGHASASHVFCPTWPTGAAPSGGRRVSGSSSSSRPRPPTLSPSLPPSRPALGAVQPRLSEISSVNFLPSLNFLLIVSPSICTALHLLFPPVYAFRHLRLLPSIIPLLALPFCIAPITVPHPSTSVDSAGVQSSLIG